MQQPVHCSNAHGMAV